MEKLLFSRTEAAAYLGISLRSLDSLLATRELASRRIGRRRLIESRVLGQFACRDHAISTPGGRDGRE
jgi:excisionase family DNA binding protein